jgi:cell division septum initiation protein DivIVA
MNLNNFIILLGITNVVTLIVLLYYYQSGRKINYKQASEIQKFKARLEEYKDITDAKAEADRIKSNAAHETERLKIEANAEADRIKTIALHESESMKKEAEKAKMNAENIKKQILTEANQAKAEADRIKFDIEQIKTAAKAEATKITKLETEKIMIKNEQLNRETVRLHEEASKFKEGATQEAAQIVEDARKEAENIASEALMVKDKVKEFEAAVIAYKNIIEGYSDDYLLPASSFLSDLAESFTHADAGEELKIAIEKRKGLVKNKEAAECDYVEENRRKTAIAFVIDAFNGKVDSAIAKVRYDNGGKLKQGIIDAFNLVNINGKAFRNARIKNEYLNARIDELKWAVAVCELREKEKEEQRIIIEQMREEERARKEYARALKEAQEEEARLQKAMEKARAQLEKSTDEQKLKYEQQISELTEKLKEAEAKNERALSMAQLTKAGHVYIISNIGSFGDDVLKIGMTRRLDPLDRVKELGDASVPFPFDVHAIVYSQDAPELENVLHKKFEEMRVNKINYRKEFFRTSITEVKAIFDELQLNAHFTLIADAREYRETLALEKSSVLKIAAA